MIVRILLFASCMLPLTACFVEPTAPASLRFECESATDCEDGQQCLSGLCQLPCSTATSSVDCPAEEGYIGCVNGTCANLCQTQDDSCPAPQSCLELPAGLLDTGGGGGGGGGWGRADEEESVLGVCTEACSATSCPDGESCVGGFCLSLGGDDSGSTGTDGTGTDGTGDTGTEDTGTDEGSGS